MATESSANSNIAPKGVKQLSDSLYELYTSPETAQVDIIFFHGLQVSDYKDAYWRTWSRDGKTIWPQTLLAEALPNARILAVSYDSCARVGPKAGRLDIFQIGENLVTDIILNDFVSVGRGRPVILVGHSLGGLVIKKFLMISNEMRNRAGHKYTTETINNFMGNLSGIFYYSTPHGGSKLADLVEKLPQTNSGVLGFLTTLSKESARLNNSFRDWRSNNNIPAYSIAESLPTKIWGVNFVIVEEGSARDDTDDYFTAPEDHFNVCKPEYAHQGTFQHLSQFISTSVRKRTQQKLPLRFNDNLT